MCIRDSREEELVMNSPTSSVGDGGGGGLDHPTDLNPFLIPVLIVLLVFFAAFAFVAMAFVFFKIYSLKCSRY